MSDTAEPLGVRIQQYFSDKAYAAGWALVKGLPQPVARAVFNFGADCAARWGNSEQLRKNLMRVLEVPSCQHVPDSAVRASYRSYTRYWMEAFRLPSMDIDEIVPQLNAVVEGREHLEKARAEGRGIVLTLPHTGNWDMAGVWLVNEFGQFATVAERLKPESLYQRFVDFREQLGFQVIPLTGAKKPPFKQLKEILQDKGIVCLLGERDLRARGIEVDFFGEKTRFPAGPAKLAKDTNSVLCPVHCWFTDDGWGLKIEEPLNTSGTLPEIAQAVADIFEKNIRQHPEDWHMLQPLWLKDLSASHLAHIENPDNTPGKKG
ncbi:MAG: phosphatidylinositol mannoside acyltransferase [Lawsonella sp.]